MRITRLGVLVWVASGLAPCPGQAQPVVIGAGYATPGSIDVAPGQVITIFARVPGKAPADPASASPPLPVTLAGFSVVLRQTFPSDPQPVPILSAADYQSCSIVAPVLCDTVSLITVQIPFELTPNAPPDTAPRVTGPQNFARLEISYNGNPTNFLLLNPLPVRMHVLNSCDAAANPAQPQACLPVAMRPDGSLISSDNPAKPGEVLTVSIVGLGPTTTPVVTGEAAPQGPVAVDGVVIDLVARVNAAPRIPVEASSVPAKSAQLQAGAVGIYQVSFTVPALAAETPACSKTVRSNLTVNIGRAASYDGIGICVDTSGIPANPSPARRHVPPDRM